MTFIDQPEGDPKRKKDKAADSLGSKKNTGDLPPDSETTQQEEKPGNQIEHIGLIGGQPVEAKGGLDISQYTGPDSKPSSQFHDPKAKYGMGPGNGLSQGEDEEDPVVSG